MVGFDRKCCKNFAIVALPLTDLLKKEKFTWNEGCQSAFDELKQMFCIFHVLCSPNFDKPSSIAMDASGSAISAVLQQKDDHCDVERPVAYF